MNKLDTWSFSGEFVFFVIVPEDLRFTEATVRRYTSKEVFLKISQYSQENISVGVYF